MKNKYKELLKQCINMPEIESLIRDMNNHADETAISDCIPFSEEEAFDIALESTFVGISEEELVEFINVVLEYQPLLQEFANSYIDLRLNTQQEELH